MCLLHRNYSAVSTAVHFMRSVVPPKTVEIGRVMNEQMQKAVLRTDSGLKMVSATVSLAHVLPAAGVCLNVISASQGSF